MTNRAAAGMIGVALMLGSACARDGMDGRVAPVTVVGAPDSASQREYGCLANRMLTRLESEPGNHGYRNRDPVLLVVNGIPLGRVHAIARDCPARENRVLDKVTELRVLLPYDPQNHDPDAKNGMVVIATE